MVSEAIALTAREQGSKWQPMSSTALTLLAPECWDEPRRNKLASIARAGTAGILQYSLKGLGNPPSVPGAHCLVTDAGSPNTAHAACQTIQSRTLQLFGGRVCLN